MLAAFVSTPAPKDPLSVLEIGERPEPEAPEGWTTIQVKAVSLNHHDLFSLQGIGLPEERMPMILGTDAAGIDEDGNEVVVHGVIASPGWMGDETLDPKRSLLSEVHQGSMAERVAVPRRNLLPKPADLSFAEAACLPTAWLTAYRMLFVRSGLRPGQTVLVQGASGGVATALIVLGRAAGYRIWVTGRSEEKRAAALALGADGINMGTRFMATRESPIHQLIKEKIVANDERETELIFRTMRNTSRVARNAVSTKVVAMEKEGAKFEDIRELVAGARGKMVYATGDSDEGIWSAGQIQGLIHDVPTVKDLVERIVAEAEEIINSRLTALTSRMAMAAE